MTYHEMGDGPLTAIPSRCVVKKIITKLETEGKLEFIVPGDEEAKIESVRHFFKAYIKMKTELNKTKEVKKIIAKLD